MLARPVAVAVTMTMGVTAEAAPARSVTVVVSCRLPLGHVVEDQRLHGDRHRVRGESDFTQVDVVEIDEYDAVDHQQFRLHTQVLAQHTAERLSQVAVENQVERLFARDLN